MLRGSVKFIKGVQFRGTMLQNQRGRVSPEMLEVLELIKAHNLKPKDIAIRRQTSLRAAYKTIKKLKASGLLKQGFNFKGCSLSPGVQKLWRYHALEFEIKPYYFFKRYNSIREKLGNHSIPFGNWKLTLYHKKIIIWLEAGKDFSDPNPDEAIRKATIDFNKTLEQMAQRYGFKVFKDQRVSIRILKHHLARTNSSLNEAVGKNEVKLKGKDGKIWLILDRSKGLREHEYVHRKRLTDDKDILEHYLTDLRENNPPTNSELTRIVHTITEVFPAYAKEIKAHITAVKDMSKAAKGLEKAVKDLSKQKINKPGLPNWFYL